MVRKETCPGCNRCVDAKKLPLYVRKNHLGRNGFLRQALSACPICKSPIDQSKTPKGTKAKPHNKKEYPKIGPKPLLIANHSQDPVGRHGTTAGGLPVRVVSDQEFKRMTQSKALPTGRKAPIPTLEGNSKPPHLEGEQTSTTDYAEEVLPPSTLEFRKTLGLSPGNGRSRHGFLEQDVDPERMRRMKLLDPLPPRQGKKGWNGYLVYPFSYSDSVVLESRIKPNATYVLSGNWKELIFLPKMVLRTRYRSQCTTVVHQDNWLSLVKQALKSGRTS
jgi:hypothetical protein